MIKKLSLEDAPVIYEIINEAAGAYKGVIPSDCYHEPYMPREELEGEMKSMSFFSWEVDGKVTGVMGLQEVKDVTLIRHAYVLSSFQRKGTGTKLLSYLMEITRTRRLLVGTWADAVWAVSFYQKHGFRLRPDKDALLIKYWSVPPRQREVSVVLEAEVPGTAS